MRVNNQTLGNIVRRKEIADIEKDIAKVRALHRQSIDFHERLAYKKLIRILMYWKKWGY